MPYAGMFLTREDALHFLASTPEFTRIYRNRNGSARSLDELGAAQAKRYANNMYRYIAQGVTVPDLGWLRGHPTSEGHKGRGAKKSPGASLWVAPDRVKLGYELHRDSTGKGVALYYATRGQHQAERDLVRVMREAETDGQGQHIVLHLTGPRRDQFVRLFEKGGWSARDLLEAIGYKRTRHGWRRQKGAKGLERFILEYAESRVRYVNERWQYVALYEVYSFGEPVREKIDPSSRVLTS